MKRKRRKGEMNCWCGAYRRKDGTVFPHRMLGGACNGGAFVSQYYDKQMNRDCRDCHLREVREDEGYEVICQALDGRESFLRCPGLEEHINFNQIPLYGMNRERT